MLFYSRSFGPLDHKKSPILFLVEEKGLLSPYFEFCSRDWFSKLHTSIPCYFFSFRWKNLSSVDISLSLFVFFSELLVLERIATALLGKALANRTICLCLGSNPTTFRAENGYSNRVPVGWFEVQKAFLRTVTSPLHSTWEILELTRTDSYLCLMKRL